MSEITRWDGLTLKDAVTRQAVLRVLSDTVKDALEEARSAVFVMLVAAEAESGAKSFNAQIEGETVGRVTLTQPKESRQVSDPEAFMAWVDSAHIQTRTIREVIPSFRDLILAAAVPGPDGQLYDEKGEAIPGLTYRPAGEPTTHSLTFEKGGKDKAIAAIKAGFAEGMVPALTDGEPR